jgi:arylsulfatase A-like enzyme
MRTATVPGLAAILAACVLGCRPASGPGAAATPSARERAPQSLLLIVVDTLRADHLGCYGYARPTSPRIDGLAREGVLFERAQSHSPWTMPSVATMFTSLEPREHGIADWKQPLEQRFLTLAEHLRARGYATEGYVSHGVLSRLYQFDQGFDVYDSSVAEGRLPRDSTTAVEVTDLALPALARLGSQPKPFFLWVHYFDPHDAYLPHAGLDFGPQPVDRYDGEIAFTDRQVGRLLDALRERGLDGRTVVALVADHGEGFGAHRHLYHTVTLFDELLHVPLLVRAPGLAPGRVAEPVALVDLAPTLLALMGQPAPSEFRGRALPMRDGRFAPDPERPIVAETQRFASLRSLRVGRHKLIVDRERGSRKLFDLEADPGEQRNLRREQPELLARLEAQLERIYAQGLTSAPRRELPPDVEEKLRSLGYVQ